MVVLESLCNHDVSSSRRASLSERQQHDILSRVSPLHCSRYALKPSLTTSVRSSALMTCYSCVIPADTERAVEILTRYQSTLQSPEEQELKASIGKVSHIFQSELFQALLGKPLPCGP